VYGSGSDVRKAKGGTHSVKSKCPSLDSISANVNLLSVGVLACVIFCFVCRYIRNQTTNLRATVPSGFAVGTERIYRDKMAKLKVGCNNNLSSPSSLGKSVSANSLNSSKEDSLFSRIQVALLLGAIIKSGNLVLVEKR
jgi:hypothetical protein